MIAIGLPSPPPVEHIVAAVSADTFKETAEILRKLLEDADKATRVEPVDALVLSKADYYALLAISILEAGFNLPQDQVDVAVSIINRVNAEEWPDNVSDVIYQPQQFEPVFGEVSRVTDKASAIGLLQRKRQVSLSQAEENLSQLAKALADSNRFSNSVDHVGGRTYFKGLTMLRHRVAAEDPMRHNKSNFFHIEPAHQTYADLDTLTKLAPKSIIKEIK